LRQSERAVSDCTTNCALAMVRNNVRKLPA
jgi:hypothetical protein